MSLSLTPLARDGDDAVREIFRSTIALGRPFPFASDGRRDHLRPYEDLCLRWYLEAGRADGALLRSSGTVVGYALVRLDVESFERWQRRATIRFLRRVLPRIAVRAYPTPVDRFYRLRLRDGWSLWRARHELPQLPHAHLNVVGGAGELPGRLLADHIDAVCRRAGLSAWCGEIKARVGRRTAALDRWGAEVVARTPNATLSWLVGGPVERLTIVRRVPARPARRPQAA